MFFVRVSFLHWSLSSLTLSIDQSKEFTQGARDAMAQAVHPVLTDLVHLYGGHETLPAHCFAYGIHLSSLYLTLCVHFPTRMTSRSTGIAKWYFRQVVLARYLLRPDPRIANLHEDLLVARWRLLVSLFTVLRHNELLSTKLQYPEERRIRDLHNTDSLLQSVHALFALRNM